MTEKISLLIVDDEKSVRYSLYHWFIEDGYEVTCAKDAIEALQLLQINDYHIILTDIRMPGMDGIEMNKRIQALNSDAIVIIMTAFASVDTAVQALKDGAYDYITKPFDPEDLSHLIHNISNEILMKGDRKNYRSKGIALENIDGVVGSSKAMLQVLKKVEKTARTNSPVLLTGEKGTGKGLIARVIHANSSRKYFDLVSVHCGAMSNRQAESELLGYEKGAFTGALVDRKGHLELADGGTLLLDEIAAIPDAMQLKLLNIVETKKMYRLGGRKEISADFRLIGTTRENLKELVLNQHFREDLYYRLNIASIRIPTLRERPEDIPLLVEHFIKKYCTTMSREVISINPEAMNRLKEYGFPGNVRELENMMERAILLCNGREIQLRDLPIGEVAVEQTFDSLEEMEKQYIQKVLNSQNWNISKSARLLKVDRVTLYNKIKKYRLESLKDN
jgi:DNA-binding NtrC family response regulator